MLNVVAGDILSVKEGLIIHMVDCCAEMFDDKDPHFARANATIYLGN